MSQVFKSKCSYPDCQQAMEFGEESLNTMQPCPGCGRDIFLSVKESGLIKLRNWIKPSITPKRVLNAIVGLLIIFFLVFIYKVASTNFKREEIASGVGGFLGGLLILAIAFGLYFLPTIVARQNGKKNETAICVLTLLLGWTVLGWIIALVWACTVDDKPSQEQT